MRENETIMVVECPVCSCRVEGRGESELSECVYVHFCEEHGMSSSEGKVIAGGQTGYGSEIERGGTRYESEPSSGSRSEAPSTTELMSQEGVRRSEGTIGGREGRKVSSREYGPSSTSLEEYSLAEAYGVQCPGCQERISGSSENETSERLREHMTTEHGNEPYMTRLLERLKEER